MGISLTMVITAETQEMELAMLVLKAEKWSLEPSQDSAQVYYMGHRGSESDVSIAQIETNASRSHLEEKSEFSKILA